MLDFGFLLSTISVITYFIFQKKNVDISVAISTHIFIVPKGLCFFSYLTVTFVGFRNLSVGTFQKIIGHSGISSRKEFNLGNIYVWNTVVRARVSKIK